jgi:hypothetical protein
MSKAGEWVEFLEAVKYKESKRPVWSVVSGLNEAKAVVTDYGTLSIPALELNREAALDFARWIQETFGD